MSEQQEHKDITGLFKGAMFQENYRKDRALYLSIVESKMQDIIKAQELINQYGDKKLSELLKDVEERYNMAKEMLNSLCKEEDEALKHWQRSTARENLLPSHAMLGTRLTWRCNS